MWVVPGGLLVELDPFAKFLGLHRNKFCCSAALHEVVLANMATRLISQKLAARSVLIW